MEVVMAYEKLFSKLQELIYHRLEHYFGKRNEAPSTPEYVLEANEDNPFSELVRSYNLNAEEQLLLLIAFVPHVDPEFYTSLIQQFLPQGGDLPVFGAAKGKNHRGIIPTGETAQFILAGKDIEDRTALQRLFKKSSLFEKGVLNLEEVPAGEPEMSGKLVMAQEYVDLLLAGKISTPSFSPDFPAQKISTEREWDDLVLSEEVKAQIEELKIWMLHNDKLMQDWQMHEKLKPGYRVLFHGPSGTGKTMTATLLGKYTGREVFRVDLSTIVSKYIGETEKNLEKLFAKADHKDWILFFDEADALFGKRTEVNDSHDRYANQEVSYLLQRVENFSGLVILSTNYKSNIDDAFLRRFNAIIKFPFPDATLRERLWKKSLPDKIKLGKRLDLSEVASRYKLSGGSIMNAVQQASLKAISSNSKTITLKHVSHGIRREVEKEGKIFTDMPGKTFKSNGKH